jgi:hypothetical protein
MQTNRVDHLVQYSVERVSRHEKKPAIVFENGVKIVLDEKVKDIQTAELDGARLQSVEDKGICEQLFFVKGDPQLQISLVLDKGKYQIFDPVTNKLVDPHAEIDPNADLPPDPSADRIKEGPTEEGESGEEGAAEQSDSAGQ